MDQQPADLLQIVQTALAPEMREAGPGDAQPTVQAKDGTGLVTAEMTPEEVGEWWTRIEKATQRVKARETAWDILLKEYLPTVKASGDSEALKTNSHFRNVHTKLGQLFYRSPELYLMPDDPSPAQNTMPNPMQAQAPIDPATGMQQQLPPLTMEDIISVKQAVLNKRLGRKGIKAARLIDELLFDVLAWAGIGCAKLGYRCVMKQVPPMAQPPSPMMPGPAGVPPAIPSQSGPPPPVPQGPPPPPAMGGAPPMASAMGQPPAPMVPVPVFEEYFARRFSPKKFIANADLRSSRIDEDATFTGMHFYISKRRAMKEFGLSEDEVSKATSDDRIFKYEEDQQAGNEGLIHCVELAVKSSYFTDEVHPQAMHQLTLVDGIRDKPVVWRPWPDQSFDPNGQLTSDSLIGFPYVVLTIRDLADALFTPADAAFVNCQVKELNTYRRQGVKLRDAAIGKYFYDADVLEADTDIPRMKEGEAGEHIPVKPGALKDGVQSFYASSTQIARTMDDYRGQDILKRDLDETLGISGPQAGVPEQTVRTATETATVQSGANARNEKERGRVVDFYLDVAEKIDQLIMRYTDTNQYIEITGIDGGRRIQMWGKQMVSGKYLYEMAPDSQLVPDSAQEFKDLVDYLNVSANDPLVNRAYLHRRIARMKGLDPSKVVLNPQQMMAQPPHGGGPANKHQLANSAQRPNEPGAQNRRQDQPQGA